MVLEELLDKVGADVYLWQLMVLMTDQHVCQQSKNASNDGNEEVSSTLIFCFLKCDMIRCRFLVNDVLIYRVAISVFNF